MKKLLKLQTLVRFENGQPGALINDYFDPADREWFDEVRRLLPPLDKQFTESDTPLTADEMQIAYRDAIAARYPDLTLPRLMMVVYLIAAHTAHNIGVQKGWMSHRRMMEDQMINTDEAGEEPGQRKPRTYTYKIGGQNQQPIVGFSGPPGEA